MKPTIRISNPTGISSDTKVTNLETGEMMWGVTNVTVRYDPRINGHHLVMADIELEMVTEEVDGTMRLFAKHPDSFKLTFIENIEWGEEYK